MADYNEIEFSGILSKDDFFKLIGAVRRNGAIDEAEAEKLVNWAIERLTGAGLVNLMINGMLKVESWSDGNPNVVPTNDALNFFDRFNTQVFPMHEENYVS